MAYFSYCMAPWMAYHTHTHTNSFIPRVNLADVFLVGGRKPNKEEDTGRTHTTTKSTDSRSIRFIVQILQYGC